TGTFWYRDRFLYLFTSRYIDTTERRFQVDPDLFLRDSGKGNGDTKIPACISRIGRQSGDLFRGIIVLVHGSSNDAESEQCSGRSPAGLASSSHCSWWCHAFPSIE